MVDYIAVYFCHHCKHSFLIDEWSVKQNCCKNCAKPPKYRNTKVRIDGILFDSIQEGVHYNYLKLCLLKGEITNLETHPKFTLHINGQKIATYTADFRYVDGKTGEVIVEDCKSSATKRNQLYVRNRKHLKAEYGITIKEVLA